MLLNEVVSDVAESIVNNFLDELLEQIRSPHSTSVSYALPVGSSHAVISFHRTVYTKPPWDLSASGDYPWINKLNMLYSDGDTEDKLRRFFSENRSLIREEVIEQLEREGYQGVYTVVLDTFLRMEVDVSYSDIVGDFQ